jgi:hypothetical protein
MIIYWKSCIWQAFQRGGDDRPLGLIYHEGACSGAPRYVGFVYDLDQPQIDKINIMPEDGASKKEIWLQAQELVVDFLSDRDAISSKRVPFSTRQPKLILNGRRPVSRNHQLAGSSPLL